MVQLYRPNLMEDDDIIVQFEQVEMLESRVPCYHFYIYSKKEQELAGHISLRTKTTDEEEFFWGNMGYSVIPKFQGRRYAYKASKLLIEFARKCKMTQIYMTVDATNIASVKTILNLGGVYLETIKVPKYTSLYQAEQCETNCRYCLFI